MIRARRAASRCRRYRDEGSEVQEHDTKAIVRGFTPPGGPRLKEEEGELAGSRFPISGFHVTIPSMIERRTLWLASGFAAGLLLTGIPYWWLPYNADVLADTGALLGFAGLGLVTAVLVGSGVARLMPTFWTMLAAFPAAVLIRVIVDVSQDPTDHNLWPFELLFAAAFALIAVVPGLLVGGLVRRTRT